MTAIAQTRDDERLKRFLIYSLILHGLLLIAIGISAWVHLGNEWAGIGGSSGDDVRVNLVSSTGIPMPRPKLPATSQTVDPTNTMHQPEPPKLEQPPPPDATALTKFDKNKPLPPTKKSKVFENKQPPPENAIPGRGGPPKIPTGYDDQPGAPSSGVAVNGGAAGDFATRYGWYIAAAKRRVDPNWDRMSIDPAARNSTTLHCAISFTIMRDGTIKNARIAESSGNLSWDNAGLRAIMNSNPLPALPSDYAPQEVSVTWDFPENRQ